MTTTFDPQRIANRFWDLAGGAEPFPRRLSPTIAAVLPVAVVLLPKLTVARIVDWLARRGAACPNSVSDRSLLGCLVAHRGHAFIFIDGTLPEDEQRVTLAHETAHFLYHYQSPRSTAVAVMGPTIKAVLDGDRPPSAGEKLRGALRDVPLGVYEHALERDSEGLPDAATIRLETEADLIAFELLAPTATVLRTTVPGDERCVALAQRFGLPLWAATRWGAWLDARSRSDGLIRRLESVQKNSDSRMSNFDGAHGKVTDSPPRDRGT